MTGFFELFIIWYMYPVLFEFGTLVVYTYGVSLTFAVLCATFLIWRRGRKFGYNEYSIIDMVLFALFLSLFFARFVYVVTHFDDFGFDVLRIVLITYFPGLDGPAAFVGGFLGILFFSFLKQWKIVRVFDCVVFGLSLGIFIIMVGAFFSGSYIGTPTQHAWGVVIPGLPGLRHPVVLYYALVSFVLYVLLFFLDRFQRAEGFLSGVFFWVYGIAFIIFEWYTEGSPIVLSVHVHQLVGVASILLGSYFLFHSHKKYPFFVLSYKRGGGGV